MGSVTTCGMMKAKRRESQERVFRVYVASDFFQGEAQYGRRGKVRYAARGLIGWLREC
jgi:hypothetical protein